MGDPLPDGCSGGGRRGLRAPISPRAASHRQGSRVSALIRVEGLGVRFQFDRQGRPVTPAVARIRRHCTSAWGLRAVKLEIAPGECVALIGPNGAGKTTLLRAIAGVLAADEGKVEVHGRLGPLLSVEAGLVRLLTGRESCRLLCAVAGRPRGRIRAMV